MWETGKGKITSSSSSVSLESQSTGIPLTGIRRHFGNLSLLKATQKEQNGIVESFIDICKKSDALQCFNAPDSMPFSRHHVRAYHHMSPSAGPAPCFNVPISSDSKSSSGIFMTLAEYHNQIQALQIQESAREGNVQSIG